MNLFALDLTAYNLSNMQSYAYLVELFGKYKGKMKNNLLFSNEIERPIATKDDDNDDYLKFLFFFI